MGIGEPELTKFYLIADWSVSQQSFKNYRVSGQIVMKRDSLQGKFFWIEDFSE